LAQQSKKLSIGLVEKSQLTIHLWLLLFTFFLLSVVRL